MKILNRKCIAFWAMAVVLFAIVTSGGCGSSTSNNFVNGGSEESGDIDVVAANQVLSGIWRPEPSATNYVVRADIKGTEVDLDIRDFMLYFQSVDVEDVTGSLYVDVVAVLSSDRVIMPLVLEAMKGDTERLSSGAWLMEIEGGEYSIVLSGTESNPSLTFSGTLPFVGTATASLSVPFRKSTVPSSMTAEERNSLINGTWMTPVSKPRLDGGFSFDSGDISIPSNDKVVPEMPDLPELPAGHPLIPGMREFDGLFTGMVFEDTDTVTGTTLFSSQTITVTSNASGDLVGTVEPVLAYKNDDVKITPIDDLTYKIDHPEHGTLFMFINEDHTTARLIISKLTYTTNGGFSDTRLLFTLEKQPDASESTFNITEQIGSVWLARGLAAGEVWDSPEQEMGRTVQFDALSLIFPENKVDIANKSLTVTVFARYHNVGPESDASDSGIVSLDIPITYVERVGYNSWYADDGDEETVGDNNVIMTALPNNVVILTAHLYVNDKEISLVAYLSRLGEDEDARFFGGAWQCFSKDATVHLKNDYYDGDVTLLNFGAKFSSVDIDSGTGYVSAVAVLSSDLIFIPIVFDNEKASVDVGSSDSEYVVTTQHGTFRVSYAEDVADKIWLQGNISHPEIGLTFSIDAALTRILPYQTRQLDFDQIMNHSTWQTTPFASQCGGFMLSTGASGAMMYPAVNAKTFANIVFDGDSTGGTINGFGVIGLLDMDATTRSWVDKGTSIPVTMINQKVDVSNIFGSYYRFEIASGDQGFKGVFILESETDAHMIMFSENTTTSELVHIYSMFTLHKVTETQTINLAAFNNSSWHVDNFGGFLLLPPDYTVPFSLLNSEPDEYSASLSSTDVHFTGADLASKTVSFDLAAYATVPAYGVSNRQLALSRQVVVEHVGAYTWYGKTVGEDAGGSEFLMVMSAAMPNRAALAGNLNLEAQRSPGTYIYASVLFDMVRKQ